MRTFDGFLPALITPYTRDDKINFTVLRDLIDYLLAKKVTGLYLSGSTGEGLFQSVDERKQVAEAVARQVNGRALILVQVGAASVNDAVTLAQVAAGVGAHGISTIVPPVVYDQRGVVPYLERIAQAAPQMPFLPYLFGGSRDCVSLMHDLAAVPNFAGTKYFGANMYELWQLACFRTEGWTVFSGMDEQALPGLMYGARGLIGSSLNFMPGAFRVLYESFHAGDFARAAAMQERINQTIRAMYRFGYVGSMRAILDTLGFECGAPRVPNLPIAEANRPVLAEVLAEINFAELAAL